MRYIKARDKIENIFNSSYYFIPADHRH